MHAMMMEQEEPTKWEPISRISSTTVAAITTVADRLAEWNTTVVAPGRVMQSCCKNSVDVISNVDLNSAPSSSVGVLLMCIMIIFLSLIVTFANALVIHVIRLDRTLHTVGNFFTASLAVADLLVGLLVIPFNILDVLTVKGWQAHLNAAHGIWVTVDFFFTTASIMNLVLLNLDRFWSITSPIKYIRQRTRRRATMLITCVWGVPVVLVFGPAVTWKLAFNNISVPSRTVFVSYQGSSWIMATGAVFIYIIPLFVLCAIYSQIYRAIHRRSKLDVGRASVASSAMSTRPGSSRRDSESQHNFITEHELQRLKGIYEKAVRRERGERQLMAMIRRRGRGYGTGAREVRRYASIDEEDHEAHCDDVGDEECDESHQNGEIGGSIYEGVNDSPSPSSDGKLADAESSDAEQEDASSEDSFEFQEGERDALMNSETTKDNERRAPTVAADSNDDLSVSPNTRARRRNERISTDFTDNSKTRLSPRALKPDRLECDLFSNGMVMCPSCSPKSRGSSRGSSPNRRKDIDMDNECEIMNRLNRSPAKNPTPPFPTTPSECIMDSSPRPPSPDQHKSQPNGNAIHCNGIIKPPRFEESILTSMQESSFTTSSENIETSPRDDDRSISPTESDPPILSDADSDTALQRPKRRTSFSFDLLHERTHCRCSENIDRSPMRSLSYPKANRSTSLTFPMEVASMNGFRSRVRQSFSTSFSALSGRGSKALMLLRKQDKAAKQLGIILTCLVVCWTPYFFQVLLYSFVYDISNTKAMTIALYLGYAHSFLNPILHALFNLRFQRGFKRVFCACCLREEPVPRPCSVPPSLI